MSVDFSYCFGRPLFISHVVFNRPSPLPFAVILRIIIDIIRVSKPLSATLSTNFTNFVRGAKQILALWPKLTGIQRSLLNHHAKSFLLHLCHLSSIITICPIPVGHLCASSAVCVLVFLANLPFKAARLCPSYETKKSQSNSTSCAVPAGCCAISLGRYAGL